MKVTIVNNIPSQYRRYLFDEIESILSSAKVDFSVFYLSEKESVRNWKNFSLSSYEEVLPVLAQWRNSKTTTSDYIFNRNFVNKILSSDVVVYFGYNYPTYMISALTRKILKKESILFCETTESDNVTSYFKNVIKKFIINRLFTKYLVPGQESQTYLMNLGVSARSISITPNSSGKTCDYIEPRDLSDEGAILRLLYVGRLADEKNIISVVEWLKHYKHEFKLSIVGSGPCESELKKSIYNDNRFEMLGHIDSKELESIYREHDALVLASKSEPWGLVVNEAINYGLAVIVSDKVGCRHELVNGNGSVFSVSNCHEFLESVTDVRNNLKEYSESSLLLSREFTPNLQAMRMLTSIGIAL